MPQVSIRSIDNVAYETLRVCNVTDDSIRILLDTIHYANRSGIPTHGIGRLPLYVNKIHSGHLNPKDEVTTVMDSDAVAILDANGGLGQVAARHAVDIAITKAERYGIAAVGVRNSNNFGAAGYYGDYAARYGMAAFIYANAAPAIAPTGGTRTILGTNPICYAFPGSCSNQPIVLDMATTVVARGKVRLAAKNGERIPFDWAVGPDGQPTDDPNVALQGSLLPIAGYKGYGLSLFVDVLAGMLTGSAYAGQVKPLSNMEEESRNGHLFVIVDVSRFLSDEERNERIDHLYQAIKNCGNDGSVMLPGEPGYRMMDVQQTVVTISAKQFEEINETASMLGVDARLEEVSE